MALQVGDKIPSVLIKSLSKNGIHDINTDSVFSGKKIVMFAVPGAFTPTCTAKHLPGYLKALEEFQSMGVQVACLAVNDPFVMDAWFASCKAQGILQLADGNATFAKALGLDMDGGAYGLGIRSQRFALFADDKIVKVLAVEKPGAFEVSSAEAMLPQIKSLI